MRRKRLAVAAAAAIAVTSLVTSSLAAAAPPMDTQEPHQLRDDNLPNPLAEAQAAHRDAALQGVIAGKLQAFDGVVALSDDIYVELEREDEDLIWTTLGEYPDLPHNSIPEPDREVDNTTIWEPDFSEAYYENLLFEEDSPDPSMRDFYLELSSNRYTVDGDVTGWVEVQSPAETYGDHHGSAATWPFVAESVDATWDDLVADMGEDAARDYLSQFDTWDRYDHDGDGDFDEPDGYIDHYQAVHSGTGAETGNPTAIWSHRWYVQIVPIGEGGPTTPDGTVTNFGGTPVGDSGYWIGDYTVEPENGGVGVFAHEYAHDLGIPDLYDTAGGENGTGFWTLMSSGSYGNDGTEDLGTKPMHMGAWEKLQLGWLDYEVAVAGEASTHTLGPATETSRLGAQGLVVVLPPKEVTEVIGEPYAGEHFYYSGSGNDLDNVMYKSVDLPADATMTAQVDYDIEVDWDYAYAVVSTDGGENWTSVPTNRSTDTNPNGQNFGHGITGDSDGWVELTADLSGFTGEALVGFRYWTDVAAIERGLSVDDISIAGGEVDGAEGDTTFTLEGFTVTTGTSTADYAQYYILENRTYRGYDESLKTGVYNFGFLDEHPDLVEHFPYQDGVLISLWDTSQTNNNTSTHPGEGLILPIDAHPDTMYRADGAPWRPRVQSFDATFGGEVTDPLRLHHNSEVSRHRAQRPVRTFDDSTQYYNPEVPGHGVINPDTGTRITIIGRHDHVRVQVRPA